MSATKLPWLLLLPDLHLLHHLDVLLLHALKQDVQAVGDLLTVLGGHVTHGEGNLLMKQLVRCEDVELLINTAYKHS